MKSYLRSAIILLAAGAFAPAAVAQTTPQFNPRSFASQQTTYTRFAVNFNSCTLPAAAGNCSFKVGAIPYNAFIVRGYMQVYTAFNSTTTDTVAVGTASGGAQLVAATSTHAAGPGAALTIVAANLGTAATGNNILPTGANGGFDIWATIAFTGATAATAGNAVVVLEYFLPNDGACTSVPMGQAAAGC